MFEKYSGKQINKAGDYFTNFDSFQNEESADDFEQAFDVLSWWRISHEEPLRNAFKLLQSVTLEKDRNAIFAKRLKRYISIVDKLFRFPKMKLKNMQDIGGCRAIVQNKKMVLQVVKELKKSPVFKTENGTLRFKDYIRASKDDGYRGFHLVGKFNGTEVSNRLIELQIRTKLQHDWATTLEIVDLFTGQALKSNQGQENWKSFFFNVSEQFAFMDEINLFTSFTFEEQFENYQKRLNKAPRNVLNSFHKTKHYAKELEVMILLEAYTNSINILDRRIDQIRTPIEGYALIEVNTNNQTVATSLFEKDKTNLAEEKYADAEKRKQPGVVIALVSTTAVGGIKQAYPNYFADSSEFVKYLAIILTASVTKNDV